MTVRMNVLLPNFKKRGGLADVVVQCGITRDILMKAKTDLAGYLNTLRTGKATFFSETRGVPWVKGEESGNYLDVIDIYFDCDGDCLVYVVVVRGAGKACHTDARTCFYRSFSGRPLGIPAPKAGDAERLEEMDAQVHEDFSRLARLSSAPRDVSPLIWDLRVLESRLKERAEASPKDSYTRKLLNKGPVGCAKKLLEEAKETAAAALEETRPRLVAESADLIYHLLVLLRSRGVDFSEVEQELQRREGQSGLQEKASRQP